MQPGDAFRVVYLRRNRGNGNGRGIAGKQRLRRADLCQLGKQRFFTSNRSEAASITRSAFARALIVVTGVRRARICSPASAESFPRATRGEPLMNAVDGAGNRRCINVVHQNRMTVAGCHFGNTGAHGAAANDGDRMDIHHLISP